MQLTQSNSVYWLSDLEMPLANQFYRKHGFRGKAKRHEACAVMKDAQLNIIASAYLRQYQDFRLLSGVAVDPAYQGQGVARRLLQQMVVRFDAQTYTFPYQQLVAFYQSLGFKSVDVLQQELLVSSLFQTYQNQGRIISLMQFAR